MMSVKNNHRANDLTVEVVRNLNDYMKVVAIRSSVFLAEQDCPYDEEFDNNDLSACHLIAYLRGEPVATLRIRWFANFAKIERVCVMKHVRGGALVLALRKLIDTHFPDLPFFGRDTTEAGARIMRHLGFPPFDATPHLYWRCCSVMDENAA